ncbi:type IV conjugative transfer system lipoprotein TraV [Marinobacter goseongensis]|uniref:type IV conjugative transfer system lipoprotein TraV n=1 Tax=Marinobacter goseongensis TaxID=453838 RepID=UPI003D0842BC
MRVLLTALMAAGTLTGCSSLGIGESDYGCKGYTEGYSCLSAREVYELNSSGVAPSDIEHHEGHDHTVSSAPIRSKEARLSGASRSSSVTQHNTQTAVPQTRPTGAMSPGQYMGISRITPIRTPAKVMRIWVDTYEDDAGDLHTPGIVYTEVQARSWQVGQPAPVRSQRIRATKPLALPANSPPQMSTETQ